MPTAAQKTETEQDRRFATRINVRIEADLGRNERSKFAVVLTNLSVSGCRFQTDRKLTIHCPITIHIDLLAPITGTVVWAHDNMVGCRFDTPLQVGICNAIIRKLRMS